MATIRAKDTKPELAVRRYLHRSGLRYKLHPKDLPGRPDIVLPRYGIIIFINGCFWHGHAHAKRPKTNTTFWAEKIERNIARDRKKNRELRNLGWKVIRLFLRTASIRF